MYTNDEIKQIINQGESSSVEFKSGDVHSESLAKEIVGLANTQGGVILVGIEDNKEVTGIHHKNFEEFIHNISRNNVIPAIALKYSEIILDDKKIGIIDVPKGVDKPYQTNKNQFLVRVGSTNRTATQAELLRLFQQAGFFHYDITGLPSTSITDLNLTKIDLYFDQYNISFSKEPEEDKISLLKNTDILTSEGNCSVAGLLVFGLNPQKYMPFASISFAHFTGDDISSELIDKQNLEGTLDYQVNTGLAVIKNNMKNPSDIQGTKRIDKNFIYEDKVFRELLVNACVHRNYSIHGSAIRIFLFRNRIEFISPGKLPNTITVDKLKAGVSYAVNPVIVKFMENLRYIDKLGRGLPMVYHEAVKNNKEIEFKEIGEEFKVVLGI